MNLNSLKDQLKPELMPKHVAIIMDGNGRWAKQRGKLRIFGHRNGVTSVREVCEFSAEMGIKYLTLYAFSTENWSRPKNEVDALMTLLVKTIGAEMPTLIKNEIKLEAIGDLSSLPKSCLEELKTAMERTKTHHRLTLVLALSYSGRWDLAQAMKQIGYQIKNNKLHPDNINENTIAQYLSTNAYPCPELLIRTSGEQRISNFLLWELAYSEMYFTEVLWPDFKKSDFCRALIDYQTRERRFGKTSEQLTKK